MLAIQKKVVLLQPGRGGVIAIWHGESISIKLGLPMLYHCPTFTSTKRAKLSFCSCLPSDGDSTRVQAPLQGTVKGLST